MVHLLIERKGEEGGGGGWHFAYLSHKLVHILLEGKGGGGGEGVFILSEIIDH